MRQMTEDIQDALKEAKTKLRGHNTHEAVDELIQAVEILAMMVKVLRERYLLKG